MINNVFLGLLILVLSFILTGCQQAATQEKSQSPEDDRLQVTYSVAQPQMLENKLKLTGSLVPNESIEIRSEINGIVEGIHFNEGQVLKQGQLLLKIRDDELSAQLEKLQLQKKLYEEAEYRQRKLLEKEAISQEEYDQALTLLNTQESEIKLLQAQIRKTEIRAPFDGQIGLRMVSEGAYLSPNLTIARFYDNDPIKVEFSVPGRYVNEVDLKDQVNFTTEASAQGYQAEVYAIEPQIDPATRSILVRAATANPSGKLLPGQFVKIDLILDVRENAFLVPSEAVVPQLNGHILYVSRQGTAKEQQVELGYRSPDNVEIVSGIEAGDTIITSGLLQIREGQPVTFVDYKNPV